MILTACVAQIGTLGSKLAIEKDWILVICGRDKTRLAGESLQMFFNVREFVPLVCGDRIS